MTVRLARLRPLVTLMACLAAGPAFGGTCTNPTGNEGNIVYNSDYHTYQFCNGATWMPYGGGNSCSGGSGYNPTAPSGSGYFVLSGGTYNGNLGGYIAANATCLTDLRTNTGWKGYSTANANGQLIASKVFAFLCDYYGCYGNLMPLTTYYFANAGNSAAGGASFTTDSNGLGPNDNANWSAANYFSGTYNYWSTMGTTSSTKWSNTTGQGSQAGCNYTWVSSSGTYSGNVGNSAFTGSNRWANSAIACSTALSLLCVVNP